MENQLKSQPENQEKAENKTGLTYDGPSSLKAVIEYVYSKIKAKYEQKEHHIIISPFSKPIALGTLEKITDLLFKHRKDDNREEEAGVYKSALDSLCQLSRYTGNKLPSDSFEAFEKLEKEIICYGYDITRDVNFITPALYLLEDARKAEKSDNGNNHSASKHILDIIKTLLAMNDVYSCSKFNKELKKFNEQSNLISDQLIKYIEQGNTENADKLREVQDKILEKTDYINDVTCGNPKKSSAQILIITGQYVLLEKTLPRFEAFLNLGLEDKKEELDSMFGGLKAIFEKLGKNQTNYCRALTKILDISYARKVNVMEGIEDIKRALGI